MDPSLMRYALHTIAGHPGHEAFWAAVEALLTPEQRQRLARSGDIRKSTWLKSEELPAPPAPPPPPTPPPAVAVALPLVKEFEGCRLTAYPDPESGGKPWTIGWGSTSYANGSPVQPGDVISHETADALLQLRLQRDWQILMASDFHPIYSRLTVNQQAALLSFTYNCGRGWFGADGFETLTRCLKAGQLDKVPGILMLYVNPGGPSEAGLRRRRRAEGALWSAQ